MSSRTIKLGLFVLFFASAAASVEISAQETRQRLVANPLRPIERPLNKINSGVQQQERNTQSEPRQLVDSSVISRPSASPQRSSVLTNDIFVRPTVSSRPAAASASANAAGNKASGAGTAAFQQRLLLAMYSRVGIPYRYGSEGPSTYDCSGLVWDVFKEAGVDLERTSAANMWSRFEVIDDADKHKFGTLVFFNRLGHIGIVIDDKTFFQASSSQGVTFSKFEGYWEKRIVGFRRVPLDQLFAVLQNKQIN